jgi:ABC-type transporter Mla subunit MlaD
VLLASLDASDVWRLALAVFLILAGVSLAWVFLSLAATLRRLAAFLGGTQDEVLPMINKLGGTVDRLNKQLDKLDTVTDSAVDAAQALDGAVRTVSHVVTAPVRKVSSFASGLTYGAATLRKRRSLSAAVQAGKEAAARRSQEVDDELGKPRDRRG